MNVYIEFRYFFMDLVKNRVILLYVIIYVKKII